MVAIRARDRRFGITRGRATLVAAGAMAATSGCSLGLDRSLLVREAGAEAPSSRLDALADLPADASFAGASDGPRTGPSPDDASQSVDSEDAVAAAFPEAGGALADGAVPDGGGAPDGGSSVVCAKDSDCPQDFAHCRATACDAGGHCTIAAPYRFVASHFTVGAGAVARPSLSRPAYAESVAAAYPYLFVVTTAGVRAFDVTSPISVAPRQVPITLLPPGIVATVAVGPLVYFVSDVSGPPNGAYQAVAWVDVTAMAGATSLQAHAAPQLSVIPMAPQVPTNITSLFNVLPAWPSGLFLVYFSNDEATYYPTASTATPNPSDTLVPFWNQALVTGADLAVASGSRLVAYTYDSVQPKLALVSRAGTSAATVSPQTTAPTPSARQAAFASNAGGAVIWTSAPVTPDALGLTAARLTRLLSDGSASAFTASGAPNTFVDLEHYASVSSTTAVVAPPVWIDATLALGLAADHANLQDTAVHVVKSDVSVSLVPGLRLAASRSFERRYGGIERLRLCDGRPKRFMERLRAGPHVPLTVPRVPGDGPIFAGGESIQSGHRPGTGRARFW